jgi:hypothetical protein
VVSRISQTQSWAIPAVRKRTDPHCGPPIWCLLLAKQQAGLLVRAFEYLQLSPGVKWVSGEGGRGRNCKHLGLAETDSGKGGKTGGVCGAPWSGKTSHLRWMPTCADFGPGKPARPTRRALSRTLTLGWAHSNGLSAPCDVPA